ncbi:YjhG/YagF family D-xylonate dehydratase [Mesobacillus maritimus]|uniref:YjhG/YagF family D-xylonate dehydratase n=1 Tax=Mesobacillus maritimus TaxID=1643336 RepID=A0ABS7KA86_9BACI|nr:YjhG/YagF family D-xylonate dehydratase [Mesobacillus maritimus]MBY0099183.1 YjhG/YagF family D-xylonate dehydratase [Mesobacillus maritimus]
MSIDSIYGEDHDNLYEINTHAEGPKGKLPVTPEILKERPSGDIFGMTLNAGMGWDPAKLLGKQVLMLSTLGGIRNDDGTPVAMGLHTGHYEIGVQMNKAAAVIKEAGGVPYAGHVSDPCDGRTQGTTGMFDSLPYRNDAAIVFRRLYRSLPTAEAVIGLAACDKGLPAMMMALASMHDVPTILIPGGSTLQAKEGEDNGTVQTIGARFSRGELSLEQAAIEGCRACASAGGGCQFLGTAGTSQVISEGLGLALPHTALAPSSTSIWAEIGTQAAKAVLELEAQGITTKDILTDKAIENAMVIHAAFGGSTNLLLHMPAIAHAAGLPIPTVEDWARINSKVPRLVSVLPMGPVNHPTSRVFLAGGVPEVMLHLRKLGLLHEDVLTATGKTLKENLDWWETSERRRKCRERLVEIDGVQPDDVIMSPEQAKERGMTSTVTFPIGNIAPEGSVVKSTAIDPSVIGEDGVFRHTGQAKVFTSEKAAIKAIKVGDIEAGDIMVVLGAGPMGTGMEETYQLTSALKHLPFGKRVSLITDARFSGVSTGACFGHVGPEALAGGPLGKVRDGDVIEIIVDCLNLEGSINFIGTKDTPLTWDEGAKVLEARDPNPGMQPDEDLPDDTRLWAGLQSVSGGTWKGCIYDVDAILEVLEAGKKALAKEKEKDLVTN